MRATASSARRGALLIAALLLSGSRLLASQAPATGFFAQLDDAPLVVTATVGGRSENPAPGIVVHELAVQRVLKGLAPAPQAMVVEDLVFPSDRPILAADTEWLVALEPLPSSSRYRSLPSDKTYFRIRGWRQGVRSATAMPAVEPYLVAAAQPAERRRGERLSALIAALPSAAVGNDALAALAADPSLARDLSEDQSRGLASALGNPTLPLERRRGVLDLIREKRLLTLLPAVRPLLAEPTLAPFARRALAACGEAPTLDALRADLEQPDPAARTSALEAARALPSADRLSFLSEVVEESGDYEVRVAAIESLGRDGPAAVPVLADLLHDPDRRIAGKAAMVLARAGGDNALAALSGTFESGSYDAQVAAVFALREIGSPDAMRVLRQVRAAPPDPRLQRALDLALGINTHGH